MRTPGNDLTKGISPSLIFTWIAAGLLFAFCVFARAYELEAVPSFIHNDESAQAIYVTVPFFEENPPSPMSGFNNFGRHPNFGAWLTYLSVELFGGKTLLAIRIGSMICGVLSILLFAAFIRLWLGTQTMLFFLAAVAPFHIHVFYSRTGFHYIHAATFGALVSFLFARVVRQPSWKHSLALGVSLGFALMVYSATLVLPVAVLGGIAALLLSPTLRDYTNGKRVKGVAVVLFCVALGVLLSMGQHLYHIVSHGFTSRLDSQSVLHRVPVEMRGSFLSHLDLVWASFKRTLWFFYYSDGAGQYGYLGAPLEKVSYTLAGIGILALLYRCARFDPNALYVLILGVATIGGSSLMVEANFSPHLIIFSLLIPLLCALGLSAICQLCRVRSTAMSAILSVGMVVPWAIWNYHFLAPRDERRLNLDTFVLRLPIERDAVRTLVNFTPFYGDLRESFYQLRYPSAKVVQVVAADVPQQVVDLTTNNTCPCLAIVPRVSTGPAVEKLTAAAREVSTFQVPRYEADVIVMK